MYSCHVYPDQSLSVIRLEGTVTGGDLASAIHVLLQHPDFDPGMARIWDGRQIQQLIVEPDDVGRVRQAIAATLNDLRHSRAAVVAKRDTDLTIAELFRAYIRGRPVQVFTDYDAALRWVRGGEAAP